MPIFRLDRPDHNEIIARAAAHLRAGELVAFPTETVYGLGANALDAAAVEKIYRAKGRPSFNPLIVHVADANVAREYVTLWPETAQELAAIFWPGPLSLVLPKNSRIPDIVTAGLPSVALRAPAHPVAYQLLEESGLPLAAPSANRFTELSPTLADHVEEALGNRVEMILDGGPCTVGIESTVVDLSGPVPLLLRPGSISLDALQAVVGKVEQPETEARGDSPRPSPGMIERHYAPKARLILLPHDHGVREIPPRPETMALLSMGGSTPRELFGQVIEMPRDAAEYAHRLYSLLHELDAAKFEYVFVEDVPKEAQWHGIRDRLRRAAKPA